MACPGIPCNEPVPPPGFTFTPDPGAAQFCDPRLQGLREMNGGQGFSLVAVDAADGCLGQIRAPEGIVQSKPGNCEPFIAGPLDNPPLTNIGTLDNTKRHALAIIESNCDGSDQRLKQIAPPAANTGRMVALRQEGCGNGAAPSVIVPEFLSNGILDSTNTAVNPSFWGVVPFQRTLSTGEIVTDYNWYRFDELHQASFDEVTDSDTLLAELPAEPNLRMLAARKETGPGGGITWKIVALPQEQYERLVVKTGPEQVTRVSIYLQVRTGNDPFVPGNASYNVTTHPDWREGAKMAILSIYSAANTQDGLLDYIVDIDGRIHSRLNLGKPNQGNSNHTQVTVPIPESNLINVNASTQVFTGGTVNNCAVQVWIDGFVY